MKEYLIRSLYYDQGDIQRIISLLDLYMEIGIENKPDETEVENLSSLIMDIFKRVYEVKYKDKQ